MKGAKNSLPLATEQSAGAKRIDPKVWRVVAVAFLGPFMTQMDSTVVNVSLATIRQELHSSITSAQWIVSGYLLALALSLPLNGWLVDRIGAKRLYLVCFSAFTLASVLCGAAPTMNALIVARVIQGVAGGLLAPMAAMMIAKVAGRQLARVMGYTTVPVLLAPILGPVVAGVILKYAPWPWLFYINLPVGVLAVAVAAIFLPNDHDDLRRRPFDFLGFLLISPGLACLLYGLEKVSHQEGFISLACGVIFSGAFIWHALRKKSAALIDLGLFSNPVFSIATRTQFLANGVSYAGQFLVPLFLITGCGLSATHAGWILAPMGLGMLCSYPMMGFLTERFGCRAVSTGGVFLAFLGTAPFLWMTQVGFSPILTMVCLFARGAGQAATGIPSASAAYASIPKNRLAIGTTAINVVQRLGGPASTTLMAIVLSTSGTYFPRDGAGGFLIPFATLVLLQMLVLTSASRLPIRVNHMYEEELPST